ncbi:hypothetical protein DDW09_00470 [Sulfolobus sp. SCGC AB-777_L09]|jgi:hypothetical protein|nr:hypothetical protein [Sulfolobaceae archaeon]PVU71062.1 hypothetical protein DDW09_00470 [Sulfolobus sp. SCGC AB-777_L09]
MTSNQQQPAFRIEFEGKAKIGEILGNFVPIQLKPEDFSSPLSLQMALSRIYEELMRTLTQAPTKHYVAEVRFNDSMNNQVVVGVDFGQTIPPLSKKEVKAKIIIEFYDEE